MKYGHELDLLIRVVPEIFKKAESLEKEISYKQKNEIVTSSDLFVESELIRNIKENYPNDHFHSEESNRDTLLKDRTWIIDPIDGTSNYAHNLGMFVVQIALYDKNEIVLAFIYSPRLNKTYYAVKGEGAYLNEQKISVLNDLNDDSKLMSMVGLSHDTGKDKSLFMEFIDFSKQNKIKIRVLGTLGFEMAAMSEGTFVILYTDVTNLWDIAPGLLLIREAGGIVVNESGNEYSLGDSHLIACHTRELLNKILVFIN